MKKRIMASLLAVVIMASGTFMVSAEQCHATTAQRTGNYYAVFNITRGGRVINCTAHANLKKGKITELKSVYIQGSKAKIIKKSIAKDGSKVTFTVKGSYNGHAGAKVPTTISDKVLKASQLKYR